MLKLILVIDLLDCNTYTRSYYGYKYKYLLYFIISYNHTCEFSESIFYKVVLLFIVHVN